ncbi:MAG: DUF4145 domain-containing protein [Candidatus Accumulibacter phosphatis]|jgi:hypothetical protein|uniref:DUF4145 domain-containing protein n=1 Tax=Candidatus Accumulibacter contiguus TaxID=2954381 RepID=A0ABX1TCD8_9PROT|nr:DUF4145 domain-containing protein [Candidatus Accumulibacter contiguus]NMQ05907.1 DUF4145 domain-containing protein [Candidatus Accumulibacter contiguus]
MTNKTHLFVSLSPGAMQLMNTQLLAVPCGTVDFPFPDYVITFRLDRSIPGQDCRLDHLGSRDETRAKMAHEFPSGLLPEDVTRLVNFAYEEALRCFERNCSMAAIGMCGRTIETVLASLYAKQFGKHPSEEQNPPGLNAMINKLRKEGYRFPAGIKERMEVIAVHRNMAIHGNIVLPSQDEARSTIYLTKDVLQLISHKATNESGTDESNT